MKKFIIIFFLIFFLINNIYAENVKKVGVIIYAKPFYKVFECFKKGLEKCGYIEDNNIIYFVKVINSDISKVKPALDFFKERKVNLVLTTTTFVILETKKYLSDYNFNVLFTIVGAPVKSGVVKSFKKHDKQITGISHMGYELVPKRVEIFKDAFPTLKRIIFFYNPYKKYFKKQIDLVKKPAKYLGLDYKGYTITKREDLLNYVKTIKLTPQDGILMFPDAIGMANADLQIKLAHKYKIPLMVLDNVLIGKAGCIGYSPSFCTVGEQASNIANLIFKGVKPSDIPVQLPDKIELAINLKEIKNLDKSIIFNKFYLNFADKVIK